MINNYFMIYHLEISKWYDKKHYEKRTPHFTSFANLIPIQNLGDKAGIEIKGTVREII